MGIQRNQPGALAPVSAAEPRAVAGATFNPIANRFTTGLETSAIERAEATTTTVQQDKRIGTHPEIGSGRIDCLSSPSFKLLLETTL